MIYYVLLVFIFMIDPTTVSSQDKVKKMTAEDLMHIKIEQADTLSWSRQFEEASKEYQEILETYLHILSDKKQLQVKTHLARNLFWSGKVEIALGAYKELVYGEQPALSRSFKTMLHIEYADALGWSKQYQISSVEYTKIMENPEYRLSRKQKFLLQAKYARSIFRVGKEREGIEIYQALLSKENKKVPKETRKEIRFQYAELLKQAEDYANAEKEYLKLLEDNPLSEDVLKGLAENYIWSFNYPQAIEFYEKLIEQFPSNASYRQEYARVLFWSQDYEESFESYKDVEDLTPESQQRLLAEGEAKEAIFNRKQIEALEEIDELVELEPTNLEAYIDRGQLNYQLQQRKEALENYEIILTQSPDHRTAIILKEELLKEEKFALDIKYAVFREKGRDGLVGMTKRSQEGIFEFDPYFKGRIQSFHLYPDGSLSRHGWQLSVLWDPVTSIRSQFYIEPMINTYSAPIGETFNWKVVWDYLIHDRWKLYLKQNRLDLMQNNFHLLSHFYRDRWAAGLHYEISPYLDAHGEVECDFYSDHNRREHAFFILGYNISRTPRLLRIIGRYDWYDTREETLKLLATTIHPYWTPQNNNEWGAALQWKHHPFYTMYAGYEKLYYDIVIGISNSSESALSHDIKTELFWEFADQWTFSGAWGRKYSKNYENYHWLLSMKKIF